MAEQSKKASRQSGGFGMGMIVGVLVGLGLALIVALYVAKVPVPFINKVPSTGRRGGHAGETSNDQAGVNGQSKSQVHNEALIAGDQSDGFIAGIRSKLAD